MLGRRSQTGLFFLKKLPTLPLSSSEDLMAVHVYIFLLVGCLLFFLARLGRLDWLHLQPSHSRGGAKRSRLHRLLKPRCPDDCPACRLASTASSGEEPAPGPVRPWREVKSRRGAPKRVNTEGFACPNLQCPYCPRIAQRDVLTYSEQG